MWILLVLVCCWPGAAHAQLQIVANSCPQSVFFGEAKNISVTFHNSSGQNFNAEIRARIFQTSSATVVLLSENPWKWFQVPAGETVVESAALNFPAVKAETKFLVQWVENTNRIIGVTEVLVYPTNLLVELKPLAGDEPLGVFDPQNQLKPLLKNLKLNFSDLENADLENFSGKFAIIGPFQPKAQMREGLVNEIKALAKKDVAIVWLQPPRMLGGKLQPSFYCVQKNQTAVVVVQPDLVSDLAENPQAQLNLIYFCKLALNPQPSVLPGLSPP